MHLLNFGVIIAFLLASTHMVVDHGGGPRGFVFIPHGSALPFHVDEREHEPDGHNHAPSDSPASSHHDPDTHTHIEWYTTAWKSTVSYLPIVSLIIASDAWLTEALSLPPHRVRVNTSTHPPPRAPLYLRHCSLLS
jgi:hypothetical protein